MPKRMREGPKTPRARSNTSARPVFVGWVAIQEFEEDVSTWTFSHWAPAINASRNIPAPKWGITNRARG